MSVSSRPRPHRGQMDGADYPTPVEANDALRRASARDRWDFTENVDPNSSQPGTGRSGRSQGVSSRSTESRIFAFQAGTDIDRTVTRALPLVGETFGRVVGQSRPRESETNRANLTGELAANSFARKLLIPCLVRQGA